MSRTFWKGSECMLGSQLRWKKTLFTFFGYQSRKTCNKLKFQHFGIYGMPNMFYKTFFFLSFFLSLFLSFFILPHTRKNFQIPHIFMLCFLYKIWIKFKRSKFGLSKQICIRVRLFGAQFRIFEAYLKYIGMSCRSFWSN